MERLFDVYDTGRSDGPADERASEPDDPVEVVDGGSTEDVAPAGPGPDEDVTTARPREADEASRPSPTGEPAPTPARPDSAGQPAHAAPAVREEPLGSQERDWAMRRRDALESASPTREADTTSLGALAPRPPLASDPERRVRGVGTERSLVDRMRPVTLAEIVGHASLVGPDGWLTSTLASGQLPPLVLWGPPGTGKRSLAWALADATSRDIVELPGSASLGEVHRVVGAIRDRREVGGRGAVLYVSDVIGLGDDEERAIIPAVNEGSVIFVGGVTANPFFELSSPLLSGCKLVKLERLHEADVDAILTRAIESRRGVGPQVRVDPSTRRKLAAAVHGNARIALEALEQMVERATPQGDGTVHVREADLRSAVAATGHQPPAQRDDMSALVAALRASDADGSVYWLVRVLDHGADHRLVARRLLMFASEDVGLADPSALTVALEASMAADRLGMPDAALVLVQATVHLALAPKSDRVGRAVRAARDAVAETRYAAGTPAGAATRPTRAPAVPGTSHLPEELRGRRLYEPSQSGHEALLAERLAEWRAAAEAAGSRDNAARGTRQGGFIDGLGRAAWAQERYGQGQDGDQVYGSRRDGSDA